MNVLAPQLTEVVEAVRQWPPDMRVTLARAILQTVESSNNPQPDSARLRGRPVQELIGLGASGGKPPSDEIVKQWIEERRWGKYGR